MKNILQFNSTNFEPFIKKINSCNILKHKNKVDFKLFCSKNIVF